MKLELDDVVTDAIVVATLKEHMKYLKTNIKNHKKRDKLEPFQAQDLGNDTKMLAAMKEVYGYFGGE